MTEPTAAAGYFRNGLPYNRLGDGPRPLIIFQGLLFENKPLTGIMAQTSFGQYKFLGRDFTVYVVTRKPGLPEGYSMKAIADDYAVMIRQEFGGPVDVIGVSTSGSIVQHFAADHPDLVRKLIIHSSAYTLSDVSKRLQMELGHLARQRQWRKVYALMLDFIFPHEGIMKYLAGPIVWLGSSLAALANGSIDPSDLVVTIEAEDKHDFKDRLAEITAPTLVIAGDKDPFYTPALFRETAAGIPNARLILYGGMGHPASGEQFARDILAFLKEDASGSPEESL